MRSQASCWKVGSGLMTDGRAAKMEAAPPARPARPCKPPNHQLLTPERLSVHLSGRETPSRSQGGSARLTAKRSFPAKCAFPNPHFGNEGGVGGGELRSSALEAARFVITNCDFKAANAWALGGK